MAVRSSLGLGSRRQSWANVTLLVFQFPFRIAVERIVSFLLENSVKVFLWRLKTQNENFKEKLVGGVERMLIRVLIKLYKEVKNKISTYD